MTRSIEPNLELEGAELDGEPDDLGHRLEDAPVVLSVVHLHGEGGQLHDRPDVRQLHVPAQRLNFLGLAVLGQVNGHHTVRR